MKITLAKSRFWLVAILAIIISCYPLLYILTDHVGLLETKSEELLANQIWNIGFYGHISLGGLALLIGWAQFSDSLRKNRLELHRLIGKIYVVAVLISGVCGIFIGINATGGLVSQFGFITLGFIWIITTWLGYRAAKSKNISAHQNYMLFSYAACFAAVTLRIWLPLLVLIFKEFILAYQIVAWLCWVPNLLVAYYIVNKRKKLVKHSFATD